MTASVIACLSQKGGVGKSTLTRLIAWGYASGGWKVKICDFNTRQLTAGKWAKLRQESRVQPQIDAGPYNSVKSFRREPYDMLVVDGRPDSDNSSLEIALAADLVIVPTGMSTDDIEPQVLFANELLAHGVPAERILFVMTRITDSESAHRSARSFLEGTSFDIANTAIMAMQGYANAQNTGHSLAETEHPTLNVKAAQLAQEVITKLHNLGRAAA